jgi:hypothetical protein
VIESDRTICSHECTQLLFRFSDEMLELFIVELVGECPTTDVRMHPRPDRRKMRLAGDSLDSGLKRSPAKFTRESEMLYAIPTASGQNSRITRTFPS